MSAGKMPASGNPPTPTPELLRCNAKVIRRCRRQVSRIRSYSSWLPIQIQSNPSGASTPNAR